MPLVTSIKRNGKVVKVPWDDNVLNCFLSVGLQEGDPEFYNKVIGDMPITEMVFEHEGTLYEKPVNFWDVPVYYLETKAPLWKEGKHKVQRPHKFLNLTLEKGDVLEMHRE